MDNPPTGTITFLFTDIEGSTRLWEQHPEAMRVALARHDELLRSAIEAHNGHIFKTIGDSFCAAFSSALDALNAAIAAQKAVQAEDWQEVGSLRIRAGIHSGEAQGRDGDYFGPPLNRVARIMAAGHGGQTLVSAAAHELLAGHLPADIELRDMGERRLRDLTQPEHIYQVLTTGLTSEFLPLKTLDYRPNNLPRQTTSLVGREREISDILTLVRRPQAALITLTGPGGTGKTRLALQVAAESLDDFPDGVWFVDLAPITDARLVLTTIAQVLSVKETADQPIIDLLRTYLRDKQLLLVLDNFEQVAEAARDIAQLLSASPKLKVVVTSRIPLRVRGEKEYSVSPLQLPNLKHLPTPDQLSQYGSVRLFVERAADVKPDFSINAENAKSIAEICTRLDGLPLAIELAAARIRLLSPDMMLSRLQNRLKLLTGGARDLPARQQTILNTIEWSYDLLDEGEKQLFRRLAVFQGGRTLDAMEAICNFDGKLQVDVLDGVESLVSKNLVQQREGAEGEPRFWMLETIHEYAKEKLEESPEGAAIAREHAHYFTMLAEEIEPQLQGFLQLKLLAQLEEEHDNMRAAIRWTRESGNAELGLRLTAALHRFWWMHTHIKEGREQLERALAQPSPTIYSMARAKALLGAGILALNTGDTASARLLFEESVTISRHFEDKFLVVLLANLALVLSSQGEDDLAVTLAEEGLAKSRAWGDKWGLAQTLLTIGEMARIRGAYKEAQAPYEESLALYQELDDKFQIACILQNLGYVFLHEGDFRRARTRFTESITRFRELEFTGGIVSGLAGFAGIAGGLNETLRAARLCAVAEALFASEMSGFPPPDDIAYETSIALARTQMKDKAWNEGWAEGATMSMEQAIEYALSDEDTHQPS